MVEYPGIESAAATLVKANVERKNHSYLMSVHYLLTALAVGSAGLAMLSSPSIISFVAFSFPMAMAPYAAYQRSKLIELKSTRIWIQQLKSKVNHLQRENSKLNNTVDEAQNEVSRIRSMEDSLSSIVERQGLRSNDFINIMKEGRENSKKLRFYTRGNTSQAIFRAILSSDFDENFHLDHEEIDRLCMSLSILPAVKVNEKKLRSKLITLFGNKKSNIFLKLSHLLASGDTGEFGIYLGD